jgi:Ser/Thr protein kinase RdoA (MazF antagonist)
VTVWAHPNDGKLRALRHLADNDARQILLRHAPRDMRDGMATDFRTLSYKPERRFVAELRRSDLPTPRMIFKMYTAAGYAQVLGHSPRVRSRDVLRVPSRLARDKRRHLLFLDWLPGRLAADLVSSNEPLGEQMALVGTALAELHDQPANPSMASSPAFDGASLIHVLAVVASIFPKLAHSTTRLSAGLGSISPTSGRPVSPVHGDFHLRQVLISTPTVGFVDFDRAGAGPAVGDIARCRAQIEWDVLTGALSSERAGDVIENLLAGYARVRECPSSRDLDACTAAALTLLLPEPFRHFRPDAFDLTAKILDRATALLTTAAARSLP